MTDRTLSPVRSLEDAGQLAGASLSTDEGRRYIEASKSEATRRAYASDWRVFARWVAAKYGAELPEPDPETGRVLLLDPVPPTLILAYLNDRGSERRHVTLARRLSAIRHHHHASGLPSPTDHPQVSETLDGIRREHRYRKDQATPLYLADLVAALEALDGSPKAIRDRAILLAGWWGAFRRSELVGLDVGDLEDHPEGLLIHLETSKTDQGGEGRDVPLHYRETEDLCPVRAVRAWLKLAGISEGPVFRRVDRWGNVHPQRLSPEAVSTVVKDAAASVGLDAGGYSAHSLRAGFVSECDRRHIPAGAVRAVTGHQTEAMLSVYSRPGQTFADSAGAYFEDLDTDKPLEAYERRVSATMDQASRQ